MLLNSGVAESMQRVLGSVQAHIGESGAEPMVVLMPEEHLEPTESVGDLENGRVAAAVVLSVDFGQTQ